MTTNNDKDQKEENQLTEKKEKSYNVTLPRNKNGKCWGS